MQIDRSAIVDELKLRINGENGRLELYMNGLTLARGKNPWKKKWTGGEWEEGCREIYLECKHRTRGCARSPGK